MNGTVKQKTETDFIEHFKGKPLIVRSPGRVNLIGEHTDYNHGFVLPAAIDKAIYVAIAPREDDRIRLYSGEFNDHFETTMPALKRVEKSWPNYILGVVDQLRKKKLPVNGFDLAIDGDVPIGSGLSSSAAVECATGFALNEVFSLGLSRMDLAVLAQKAEHEFAGVRVGIMDMFASLFGKKDQLIKLDCQSLDYEYVPLKLEGYKLLLLNTNVKHSLGNSEYNTRRQQCEQGVVWVREYEPQVNSLRDTSMEMLDRYVKPKDELIYKRCKYVVEEKDRLLSACVDLKNGHVEALGKKMFRTHEGLSREYEVSCPELDFLVDAVKENGNVLGARMMGGGFGGCTINIVREDAIEQLVDETGKLYQKYMNMDLTAYVAQIEDGTGIV